MLAAIREGRTKLTEAQIEAIQIRMPNDIHDRVKELAAREGVSLNAFLVNSVSNEVVRKETRDFFTEGAKGYSADAFADALRSVPNVRVPRTDRI